MDASPADQVAVVPDHMATFSPGMKLAAIMATPRITWNRPPRLAPAGIGAMRISSCPAGRLSSSSARLRRPMKQA